ncbi:hypothetical protein [Streptomyces sp. NPDC060333]|uniref:hypothetical protein n=1 Tax=Streptomyces sp. NPDC060333 TaxID=3347098 RepID=UPI0036528C04
MLPASEEPTTTSTSTTADLHAACARSLGAHRLLIMTLFATVIALVAALVESLAGAGVPAVLRSGGTAFATAVGLCLGAVPAVRELRKRYY